MNYFALFNLPEQYDTNLEVLRERYETLQRLTHPDKYASASEQEQRMYMQKNTQVNDAYHVLQSPVYRGEHLLEVRGVQLPSEQETIGDTAFLMEQMELREALSCAESQTEFELLEANISEMQADYSDRITLLLNNNAPESNISAGIELNKLKFLIKLAKEVKARKHFVLNA